MATIIRHVQVTHEGSSDNGMFAESGTDFVHAVFQALAAATLFFIDKQVKLDRLIPRDEAISGHTYGPHRIVPAVIVKKLDPGSLSNLHRALRGKWYLALLGKAIVDLTLTDVDLHSRSCQPILAQLVTDIL